MRDHGPGVPEKDLKLIFEPFYRVDAARDRAGGGEGLGLAIAARAIVVHGGSIEAHNVPDGGLEVSMRLPALERRALEASNVAVESSLDLSPQKKPPWGCQGGRLPTVLASGEFIPALLESQGGGSLERDRHTGITTQSSVCLNPQWVRRANPPEVEPIHVSLDF